MSKAKIITKTKPLTAEQYAEMKTRYQMGESIRSIAKEYNYDSGNLTRRFKKEGITQGALQQLINKKTIAAVDSVKTITADIQQITSPLQQPMIQQILDKRSAQLLSYVNEFTDIAFKLNRNLLVQVNNLSKPDTPGGYKPHEAMVALGSLISNQTALLNQTGISAKNINQDNSSQPDFNIITDPVSASRAYQDFIKSSK